MRVGGLFSGIGGWELGLERAGMQVVWHCEQDPYCVRVLEHHWPDVPVYPDVCDLRGADVEPVDVLCGGFPCQDISSAGKQAGIDGARSGLWAEYARLVGELRPRYVLVENVADLLVRGFGRVVGDLAALGYDAEWDCIPASAVGAPHRRDRVWLVAYPHSEGLEGHRSASGDASKEPDAGRSSPARVLADPDEERRSRGSGELGSRRRTEPTDSSGAMGHANSAPSDAHTAQGRSWSPASESGWWTVEPDVGRVAHGVPARVDRLAALGNALVPQLAEWIGRRIICWERLDDAA